MRFFLPHGKLLPLSGGAVGYVCQHNGAMVVIGKASDKHNS